MDHMNEIIKKFNDTTFSNPDAVELNKVYDLIRSASQTTCEIAFPASVVLEVCKIFLNKVFEYYVGDKVDDNSLKHHLLIIHTLLAIPQAGHEECITGVIQEIVMLIFDPSCNFWLCLHLVKLANKILIMQNNVYGKKYIGYGVIENYLLCRLMDRLFTCADYVLQSTILELLFRLKKDIQDLSVDFFPKDFDLQRALDRISPETFDIDCRHFLNIVNQNSKNVFSIQAEFITADGRSLLPPSDFIKSREEGNSNLWVDFNKDSHTITINVSLNCIVPVKLNEEDSDSVLIIIKKHAIDKFSRKKLKNNDMNLDLLIINLSHSIVINNSVCKKFAKKCKLIKIAFKSNSRVNLLHDEVLGEIFKNTCFSKSNISSSSALNRNPLPINVISNNSKSIYTSISEKSLGYLIRKEASELNRDSEKFDTCPENINVVSNSIHLNIPKPNRKKRATLTKSRRRKMSVLDSISEDEEYHSQHLIHSSLKSDLVKVSTSVNFSDVTSIHSDSSKGSLDSRSIDAQNSATNSRSDIEIDENRYENQLELIHVLSNSPSNFVKIPKYIGDDTSLKQNVSLESSVKRSNIEQIEPKPFDSLQTMMQPPTVDQVKVATSNSRLLASKTNSEASKFSQGSRYNTRSKNKLGSAIVILENMKLPINKDTYQMYNKTRKVSLSLRKRSSGRLSLPDEEKFIGTPKRIPVTKHDLPERNEIKIMENIESDSGSAQKKKNEKQKKNNFKDFANENMSSEIFKCDVNIESKRSTSSTDNMNMKVYRKKSKRNMQKPVSETISKSPTSTSSKTNNEEAKIVENVKEIDIMEDSRENSPNHFIEELNQDVKDTGKVKVLVKSPKVAGSLKAVNNEESQPTKNEPEIVNLPNEKQTVAENIEQARFFNQFNADEEEVIQNTYESLTPNPTRKRRKRVNKNKLTQESSKSNVDLNQSIVKSAVLENYQEISSLADEVWSQAEAKIPKKRSRQNKKISKSSDKLLSSKQNISELNGTSLGGSSSFNAKAQKSIQEDAMENSNKLKGKDISKNRNEDLLSEKSKITNVDGSTNERNKINKNVYKRRQSQSESEITTKKSIKRRKLYNLNDSISVGVPADKPHSDYNNEQEEIHELTQEEVDSKNYLFNKLISGEDSKTNSKFQKPDEPRTEYDESRADQQNSRPRRPSRSCTNRKVDRKIEMSNCNKNNKKMNDGMIRKKYVRRSTKKINNNSTIPINSVVTDMEIGLFDKLCQTTVMEQSTMVRKPNNTHINFHKYEIMISKIRKCYFTAEKLMLKLIDSLRLDQDKTNMPLNM